MRTSFPDDVAGKVIGRVRVAVSQLDASKPSLAGSASWVISSWTSKLDLITSLHSTDFLPCFAGLTTYTTFRNQPVIDGGYANGFEELCPDSNTAKCLKLASWAVGPFGNLTGCAPHDASGDRTDRVKQLYQNPKLSSDWALEYIQEQCPVDKWSTASPGPLSPKFVPQNSTTPDICGYAKMLDWKGRAITACEWQEWSMKLPSGQELAAMDHAYRQGAFAGAVINRQRPCGP
ncbi:hypothetical protein MNEG_6975 [Monoraphidium neglectum]|uniref:Uncharacterized protein n=1 Tax=Monoraphidium neglectum TaxID=145388 RepID=A0A0D2MK54_9CHLO|nr:hypothetical protein MNEG_6975 [Monoraphidium neglectum]KIZ00987.1 hypothetical protein MNEG_6975 [Monoraphidium neglectum]|eukprot:XP_013900006.1 hypothetical protein MNEG_6975 [Monoraphidium neglectum]